MVAAWQEAAQEWFQAGEIVSDNQQDADQTIANWLFVTA
jgi:hypothetical protein